MADIFGQGDYAIRFDWGPNGAHQLRADVSVVVDVLSFSTAVTIAVERGMDVYPFPWNDLRAAEFAAAHDATLAVGRLESTKPGSVVAPSLSPAGLLTCRFEPRIVLPSPNGSSIAASLLESGSRVAVGCLRNARAVANWLRVHLDEGRSVAVIAAGERWVSDGSLRPALEDQLGAGAILSTLRSLGCGESMSPESVCAATLFDAIENELTDTLQGCVGGRELIGNGFQADVAVAAELNSSAVVPMLADGAFRSAR
ncbi:2-phosphosulfolactate phosphatase [Flexivirga alba]|uniref:Probable 2-phosphosulfolactate phosphatase n=1 Tax=Flexivirga alba TaxID=702742 RepID=A0ABW2AKU3_9MICO